MSLQKMTLPRRLPPTLIAAACAATEASMQTVVISQRTTRFPVAMGGAPGLPDARRKLLRSELT